MRGALHGPVVACRSRRQVPAHVPTGNADAARERNHDVRKILADTRADLQRIVDRRIHMGVPRRVGETAEYAVLSRRMSVSGSASRRHASSPANARNSGVSRANRLNCRPCQSSPVAASASRSSHAESGRLSGTGETGCYLDDRIGCNPESRMPPGHIEVMDDVAERILIGEHPRARLCRQLEAQASLASVAARLHAHLHHAFADGRAVGEAIGVPNQVLDIARS